MGLLLGHHGKYYPSLGGNGCRVTSELTKACDSKKSSAKLYVGTVPSGTGVFRSKSRLLCSFLKVSVECSKQQVMACRLQLAAWTTVLHKKQPEHGGKGPLGRVGSPSICCILVPPQSGHTLEEPISRVSVL
jgi:hypothetical protein